MTWTETHQDELGKLSRAGAGVDELLPLYPTQGKAEPITAQSVRAFWEQGERWQAPEIKELAVNTAYVEGDQWVKWNPSLHRVEKVAPPAGLEDTLPINRLRAAINRRIARLLRRPFVYHVAPGSPDDASVQGAKVAQAVITDHAHKHNWEGLRHEHAWLQDLGGTVVIALEWDPSAGEPLGTDPETGLMVGTGDACTTVLDVSEAVFEPGTRDARTSLRWAMGRALPVNQVWEKYRLDEKPHADASARTSPAQRHAYYVRGGGSPEAELVLVVTYYERPNWLRPEGAMCVVINDKIVHAGPWPFPFTDHLNVNVCRVIPNRNRWTGQTVLSDARNAQRAVNQAFSSIAEHLKKAASAKFMAPEGSFDPDEWDDDPANPLFYRPEPNAASPGWSSPPQLPTWALDAPTRFENEIDDSLNDYPIGRGGSTGSLTSAAAIAQLAEQGDSPLIYQARAMAEAWEQHASDVLELLAAKVTIPRKAVLQGTPGTGYLPEVLEWTGADLAGQTRVRIPLDAVAPISPTAQLERAVMLADRGIISDWSVFIRYAGLPDTDDLLQLVDPHLAKAMRENHEMFVATESFPVPAPFDDHRTHIHMHNAFRASERYERLSEQHRLLIDKHVLGHQTMAMQEAQAMQNLMGAGPLVAGAAQGHEPESPIELAAAVPNVVRPMGGTAPEPAQPALPPTPGEEPNA